MRDFFKKSASTLTLIFIVYGWKIYRWMEGTLDVVVSAPDFQNRFLDEPGSVPFFFAVVLVDR